MRSFLVIPTDEFKEVVALTSPRYGKRLYLQQTEKLIGRRMEKNGLNKTSVTIGHKLSEGLMGKT